MNGWCPHPFECYIDTDGSTLWTQTRVIARPVVLFCSSNRTEIGFQADIGAEGYPHERKTTLPQETMPRFGKEYSQSPSKLVREYLYTLYGSSRDGMDSLPSKTIQTASAMASSASGI